MAGEQTNIADVRSQDGKARSTVVFPYTGLDDAEKIAKGVRELGATACDWDQLAAHLKFAAAGGGFRLQMIGAKTYGLVTYERGRVQLTETGLRIVDPNNQRGARVEAFLTVPLFKLAYEKLKGQPLPPAAAIERQLESLGVAPKQKDKARQSFMRSAKHAGFMEIAQDRLTIPANIGPTPDGGADAAAAAQARDDEVRRKGGNGGGNDPPHLHHFIRGLLEKLPAPETEWATKDRVKWLQTAANIFDLIYTASGEEQPVEVKVKKEQAP